MTTTPHRIDRRLWAIYTRIAPLLLLFCMAAVVACSVGVYVEARTNRAQDAQRIEDQARAQRCFDHFASTLAGGLPPVRKASQARDAALGDAMGELEDALRGVVNKNVTKRDIVELVDALDGYGRAEDHLNKVRAAHPYPSAPSDACHLSGK